MTSVPVMTLKDVLLFTVNHKN